MERQMKLRQLMVKMWICFAFAVTMSFSTQSITVFAKETFTVIDVNLDNDSDIGICHDDTLLGSAETAYITQEKVIFNNISSPKTIAKEAVKAAVVGKAVVINYDHFVDVQALAKKVLIEVPYVKPVGKNKISGAYFGQGNNSANILMGYQMRSDMYGTTTSFICYSDYINSSKEKKLNQQIKKDYKKLKLKKMSSLKKIKTVHDYIAKKVTYDYDAADSSNYKKYFDSRTAYGAALKKKGVCSAYAIYAMRLLNYAGIDATVVLSYDHEWNLVKYKGKYYNMDITWDDQGGVRYDYFMKTNKDIQKGNYNHNRDYYSGTKRFKKTYKMAKKSLEM